MNIVVVNFLMGLILVRTFQMNHPCFTQSPYHDQAPYLPSPWTPPILPTRLNFLRLYKLQSFFCPVYLCYQIAYAPKCVLQRFPHSKDLLSVAEWIKKWTSADCISLHLGFLLVWGLGVLRQEGNRILFLFFFIFLSPIIFQLNLSRGSEFYFPNMNHWWSNKLITHPSCPPEWGHGRMDGFSRPPLDGSVTVSI